jgi:hypothetical protein
MTPRGMGGFAPRIICAGDDAHTSAAAHQVSLSNGTVEYMRMRTRRCGVAAFLTEFFCNPTQGFISSIIAAEVA